jgi:hypothetical protein
MWDPAGARLRPHPVLRHSETLSDVVDGQEAGHKGLSRRSAIRGNKALPSARPPTKLVDDW